MFDQLKESRGSITSSDVGNRLGKANFGRKNSNNVSEDRGSSGFMRRDDFDPEYQRGGGNSSITSDTIFKQKTKVNRGKQLDDISEGGNSLQNNNLLRDV